MKFVNPICLSLDCNDLATGLSLIKKISSPLGCIKLGPRLVLREGPKVIEQLKDIAPIFLDFKFYDIPSTTLESVRSAFELGATLVTVHASLGLSSLKELAQLESELNQIRPFKILAVTVLTSYSQKTLPMVWQKKSVEDLIKDFAYETISAGLTGIVCSPHEITSIKGAHPKAFVVTPGIRLPSSAADDQSRVSTPKEAMTAGADLLVIGRPILQSADPAKAVKDFIGSLS
jgi:orotidine-5'-phosphate decarboxylase